MQACRRGHDSSAAPGACRAYLARRFHHGRQGARNRGLGQIPGIFYCSAATAEDLSARLAPHAGYGRAYGSYGDALRVFAGVIGGLIAVGIIRLFIGPVVLAVAYTLLKAWMSAGEQKAK